MSLTILALFAVHSENPADFVALPFFALCLSCLVASLYYSIRDITVSMGALELEIKACAQAAAAWTSRRYSPRYASRCAAPSPSDCVAITMLDQLRRQMAGICHHESVKQEGKARPVLR